jgi:hypothetical protein
MAGLPAAATLSDNRPMTLSVDTQMAAHIKARFAKLIWEQVRPWAYFDTDGVKVRTHDGRTMSLASNSPARDIMWDNYIEPFLLELCGQEIAAAGSDAQRLKALRHELYSGIVRTYWVMADIHRNLWPLPFRVRPDTSHQVAALMDFVDTTIAAATRKAA